MNENQQAPVAQTFTFEKKMGSQVLTFTVSVLLLGVETPTPAIAAPKGSGLPDLPATTGESLWFVTVNGPATTSASAYRGGYNATVTPEQVARWELPFHGAELVSASEGASEPTLPTLFKPCDSCGGDEYGCIECEFNGVKPTAAGWQVLRLLHAHGLTWEKGRSR